MATLKDVEDCKHTAEALALLCKKLGYKAQWEQLQFNNGASVTNLLEFFGDNPGAIEAVLNWIIEENPRDSEGEELPETEDEEEGEEEEENV